MGINRRNFLKTAGGLALLTIVPSRVLGGPKHVAPSDQLTKGIIGVGGIGRTSYHFTSDERCRLVAICDVDKDHLASALELGKQKFGQTLKTYHFYRDLINDPNVDIVHIATPPHWHGIMAVEAARAGKDIWCEKPMTRTPMVRVMGCSHQISFPARAASTAMMQCQRGGGARWTI